MLKTDLTRLDIKPDDFLLINAHSQGKDRGILIHSTTKRYWDVLWDTRTGKDKRFLIGVIRKGLFHYVDDYKTK